MKKPSYTLAIAEAILVNLIWATSFIIVKLALDEISPMTISGLRYFIGALILLPFMLREKGEKLTLKLWGLLLILGIAQYTIGNGAIFWSLEFLPATTVSFLMGSITIATLIGGIFWLKEIPTKIQVIGIIVALVGGTLFFAEGIEAGEKIGLVIFFIGMLGITYFTLAGRKVARAGTVTTLQLTGVPLLLGGIVTLLIAIPIEGIPSASPSTWGLVLILAAVNTALGYFLYNHALQVLTAIQMNIILSLTPVWTAIFGFFLLDERLGWMQMLAMAVVISGVVLVQVKKKESALVE
jgi:drug/metabolite transporter (DMT)-like permease